MPRDRVRRMEVEGGEGEVRRYIEMERGEGGYRRRGILGVWEKERGGGLQEEGGIGSVEEGEGIESE